MTKTKTPLFSMGAHGSVGGSITAQKRGTSTLLRKKPSPTDPYSLAQAYQRWLYQDYSYLWRQQSVATQRSYAAAGARFHLTGFQYWMKYQLKNLPDIIGWWKLDDNLGATTIDSSHNSYHGTIVGASPASGLISEALYFDGLNDRVAIPPPPVPSLLTLECLVITDNMLLNQDICNKYAAAFATQDFTLVIVGRRPRFYVCDGTARDNVGGTGSLLISGKWYHIVCLFDPPNISIYINGSLYATKVTAIASLNSSTTPLYLGNRFNPLNVLPFKGTLDNVILYNRILDFPTIVRHSERRYPA